MALVEFGRAQFKTGQLGRKSVQGSLTKRFNLHGWRSRSYSSGNWPGAVTLKYPAATIPKNGQAKLYRMGSRYVWTRNTKKIDVVLLRFVVGGEAKNAGAPTRLV